jgi:hypothetical protein
MITLRRRNIENRIKTIGFTILQALNRRIRSFI